MLKNYIQIATRNLLNSKLYSSINIIGLSVGIACCLLLALLVLDELSYDRFNKNADDIYRVVNLQIDDRGYTNMALTPGMLGPELVKNFAEVKAATRVSPFLKNVQVEGKQPVEGKFLAVDSTFLSIFTVRFKSSAKAKQIISPRGIAISHSAAHKLFGKSDPIGRTVTIADIGDLAVTGVFYDLPSQFHLRADFIISFLWIERNESVALTWNANAFYNYVLLPGQPDVTAFNNKLDKFVHQYTPSNWKDYHFYLQPLTNIHLNDTFHANAFPSIGWRVVISFITVGVIILLLACFNYMNMATARSARRAFEVGVRKVMGAYRLQLIGQFLSESLIVCTLSFLLALLWAGLALPLFNAFLNFPPFFEGRDLGLSTFFSDYKLLGILIFSMLFISVAAGSYPAFYLSKFVPAKVLKSQHITDTSRRLRKGLVLMQFALTTILLVMSVVVFRQTEYMKSKDPGFNKEQLLVFSAARDNTLSLENFKTELRKIPGVKNVTSASALPGRSFGSSEIRAYHAPKEDNITIGWLSVDEAYIPTLQLDLIAGRNFRPDEQQKNTGVIINELTAEMLGCYPPEKAVGKPLSGFIFSDSIRGEVIGVVKNFHASSLRREIAPMALRYGTDNNRFIVKLEGDQPLKIQNQINGTVRKLIPDKPFESKFFEDYLDNVYLPEEKTAELLTIFTVIAIIIGCTGLYALSAYESEQRTKEMGIRKTMGATSFQLLAFMSKGFMKLVVIAVLVSMPLAYFLADFWLHTFPYFVQLSGFVLVQCSAAILILALFTILAHALKTSRLNPAVALRYE